MHATRWQAIGATIIATGGSDDKLEVVRQHGATHVINTAGADGGVSRFRDQVKELTDGKVCAVERARA